MKILDDGTVIFENPLDSEEGRELVPEEDDGRVEWEVAACYYYAGCGNISATARKFCVSVYAVKKLMQEQWWQDKIGRIYAEQKVYIDAGFSKLVERGIEMLADRMENGDFDDFGKRRPLKALDVAKITDMSFMKRQLIRNEPTSVSGGMEDLSTLARHLRAIGKADPSILEAPGLVREVQKAEVEDVEPNPD